VASVCLVAVSLVGVASAEESAIVELIDPASPGAEGAFSVVNDVVMGGRSNSRVAVEGEALVFSGTLRLDRGGGFASMRANLLPMDLRAFSGIELVVRGDGRRYKLHLRDDVRADGVRHQAAFETRAGEVRTLRLPFSSFEPRLRGRRVPHACPLDRSRIQQLGLLVSDAQAGDFRLALLAIRAYR
jgi:hypothetical protein